PFVFHFSFNGARLFFRIFLGPFGPKWLRFDSQTTALATKGLAWVPRPTAARLQTYSSAASVNMSFVYSHMFS
ncbi:hypothetical protein, partial [Staphylococcus chromogenes]